MPYINQILGGWAGLIAELQYLGNAEVPALGHAFRTLFGLSLVGPSPINKMLIFR